jgi:hypothetical protein
MSKSFVYLEIILKILFLICKMNINSTDHHSTMSHYNLKGYQEASSKNRRLVVLYFLPFLVSTLSFVTYFINNPKLNTINIIILYLLSLFAISTNYIVDYYNELSFIPDEIDGADEENQIYSQYKENHKENQRNLHTNMKSYYPKNILDYFFLWSLGKNIDKSYYNKYNKNNKYNKSFTFFGLKINCEDELP